MILTQNQAAVVGGGVAGFAAALTLLRAGTKVTLFEAARWPGGRVGSPNPNADCGRHVLIEGYEATRELLGEAAWNAGFDRRPLHMALLDQAPPLHLREAPLPPPLSLAGFLPPLLRLIGFAGLGRLAAARHLTGPTAPPSGWTAARWFEHLKLPNALVDRLLAPLVRATCNLQPGEVDAGLVHTVFRESFGRGVAARICVPKGVLPQVLVAPLLEEFHTRGGVLRLGAPIKEVERAERGWRLDGTEFAKVALAIPPHRVARWFPEAIPESWRAPSHRPIVTVVFAALAPSPAPIALMPGHPLEWLIDQRRFSGKNEIEAVVSGDPAWAGGDLKALAQRWGEDLKRRYPGILGQIVRIEAVRQATVDLTPERVTTRPKPGLLQPGLVLAGDWCSTGLPATIESAVRSGVSASRVLLAEERPG